MKNFFAFTASSRPFWIHISKSFIAAALVKPKCVMARCMWGAVIFFTFALIIICWVYLSKKAKVESVYMKK